MQACKQDIDKKNVNSENQNLKFELIKSAHSKVFFKNNIFEDKKLAR